MKALSSSCAAIILAVIAPAPVLAQTNGPVTLTWPDILEAIDAHPAMVLARARIEHARAGAGESPIANPEISGSAGMGRSADGRQKAVIWGIDIELALDDVPSRVAQRKVARADAQAEVARTEQTRNEVIATLHLAFIQAAIRREMELAAREAALATQELAEVAIARHGAGEGRRIDVVRLESESEIRKYELSGAVRERQAAFLRLNRLLGATLPEDFDIQADWMNLPEIGKLEDLLTAGIDSTPVVRAADAYVRAGQAAHSAERAKRIPGFRIGGFFERELDSDKFGASVSITVPLWDHNRKGIEQAAARVSAARAEADLARLEFSDSLVDAHARAVISKEASIRYRDVILPMAEQASSMAGELYKAGEIGLFEAIDTRAAYLRTRQQMLDTFMDGWRAAIELQAITGVTP